MKPKIIWKPWPGAQQKFLACPTWECLLHGNRGGGKQVPDFTKILTYRGYVRIDNLSVGDLVYSSDGNLYPVTGIFPQGVKTIYKMNLQDKRVTLSGNEHLWKVVDNHLKERVISTIDMYNSGLSYEIEGKQQYKFKIPNCEAVHFQKQILPIDPYILGCLISKGTLITETPKIATSQQYGLNRIKKTIPKIYKFSSIDQRMELLQGLIDTDGSVEENGYSEFTSTSKKLIKDVAWICRSLGIHCKIEKDERERIKYSEVVYRLYINTSKIISKKPEFIQRLKNKPKSNQEDYVNIVKIEKLSEKVPMTCISVDSPDHTYLIEDFVVTHNTDVLIMDYLQGVGRGYGQDYKGLLLREATTELGDVISKCKKWIPRIFPTAKYNGSRKIWLFENGETLWLNYARTLDDYEQYHGHEYSIKSDTHVLLPNNETIPAKDIKIGDLVQTLQGQKKITKIFNYKKPGVKVSIYDSSLNLIGTQIQGILHPVLTNAGWRRIGCQVLFQMSPQSSSALPLLDEVREFLFGIHQQLYEAYDTFAVDVLRPTVLNIRQLLYDLTQIHQQFSDWIILSYSKKVSRPCDFQEILENFALQKDMSISDKAYFDEFQEVLRLLEYCISLRTFLLSIRQYRQYVLRSILCRGTKLHAVKVFELFSIYQQYQNEIKTDPLRMYVFGLLVQDQISWNDTFAYVQSLFYNKQDYPGDYSDDYNPNDELLLRVLKTDQSSFPLQNDEQYNSYCYKGVQDNTNKSTYLMKYAPINYIRPYSHESCQTTAFDSFYTSFSISSWETPIDMVDFTVEDEHNFISSIDTSLLNIENNANTNKLSVNNYQKSQQYHLVNSQCWIGWEELTNHPFPDVYLKLMSCNRSSNPNIIPKYRATCNPSGPGHSWVKERFINSILEGKILRDKIEVEYPDKNGNIIKKEITITRSHVRSYASENKSLMEADPTYIAKIHGLTQDDEMLRKAWIDGSWDLLIGGFFTDVWDRKIHIINPFRMNKEWDLVRSFDWGSSKPWSVTYGVETNGQQSPDFDPRINPNVPFLPKDSVIIIGEIYGWSGKANEGDRAESPEIAERVISYDNKLFTEYGLKAKGGPADLNIFEVRDGKTMYSTMRRYGCSWTRAYKGKGSRVSGWATIRQMLGAAKRKDAEKPHLYFFPAAIHHIRTLPEQQRDHKKPEDIDCFVSGTEVKTKNGYKPIECIQIGDYVQTPIGLKRVIKSGPSGVSKTFKVKLSNNKYLQGTPNHKIFVKNIGLVPLCKLKIGDELCQELLDTEVSSSHQDIKSILNDIQLIVQFLMEHHYCTEQYGKIFLEKFQKDMEYTTKTISNLTRILTILNVFLSHITQDNICKNELKEVGICTKNLKNEEELKNINNKLLKILLNAERILKKENLRASIVVILLLQSAVNNFWLSQKRKEKQKLVVMEVVGNCEESTVYNLTTEQAHLYYANNCLVSNTDGEDHCADGLRYLLNRKNNKIKRKKVRH